MFNQKKGSIIMTDSNNGDKEDCILSTGVILFVKLYSNPLRRFACINPFPHIAILQQTTCRKILNVHSAEEMNIFKVGKL